MKELSSRAVASVFALFLLIVLLRPWAADCWTNYWLMEDSKQVTGTITKELWTGHNGVGYTYIVDRKEYKGEGNDTRYARWDLGAPSVVYYSASHPWLSGLRKPDAVVGGLLPPLLIVLFFESMAVVAIINPKSKWAFLFAAKQKAADGKVQQL